LTAAIRLGSLDALSTVAQRTEELRSNPKWLRITDAIHNYFKPEGAAIAPLQQIAALRSDIPGLDAAAGSALQKVGTKDVLPAMALMLDTHDPQAQLTAAAFRIRENKFPARSYAIIGVTTSPATSVNRKSRP
jgi:hypothetical protein